MAGSFTNNFYRNQEYSDLVLVCQNREWPGHRMIICPQSLHIHNRTAHLVRSFLFLVELL